MGNLLSTYQLIADILSYESDDESLKCQLKKKDQDWESLVKAGSSHLVLPTIYCRLKSKKLLDVIPKDLKSYLKEITELNRERNLAIIAQVKNLVQLLDERNIEYVFLKGAALLVGDYYEDISERMIGDIDILIAESELHKAFELLKNETYTPLKQTLGNRFLEHLHLPRLVSDNYICAVELHRKVFNSFEYPELTNSNILDKKSKQNNFCIPDIKHLLLHNILNYQVNDKGKIYGGLNFRVTYDTLSINKHFRADLSSSEFNSRMIKRYYYRHNVLFDDFKKITSKKAGSFFIYRLKNQKFRRIWYKCLTLYSFSDELSSRLLLFTSNNEYRAAIWSDRKRIINHIRLKLLLKP